MCLTRDAFLGLKLGVSTLDTLSEIWYSYERQRRLMRVMSLGRVHCYIVCGQIRIGNAATEMSERIARGVPQAYGAYMPFMGRGSARNGRVTRL